MDDALHKKLAALSQSYGETLPVKLQEIEALLQKLQTQWEKETLAELHRKVHVLHGSSGTYGYKDLSQAAGALEQHLNILLHQIPPQKSFASVEKLYQSLEQASHLPPDLNS